MSIVADDGVNFLIGEPDEPGGQPPLYVGVGERPGGFPFPLFPEELSGVNGWLRLRLVEGFSPGGYTATSIPMLLFIAGPGNEISRLGVQPFAQVVFPSNVPTSSDSGTYRVSVFGDGQFQGEVRGSFFPDPVPELGSLASFALPVLGAVGFAGRGKRVFRKSI